MQKSKRNILNFVLSCPGLCATKCDRIQPMANDWKCIGCRNSASIGSREVWCEDQKKSRGDFGKGWKAGRVHGPDFGSLPLVPCSCFQDERWNHFSARWPGSASGSTAKTSSGHGKDGAPPLGCDVGKAVGQCLDDALLPILVCRETKRPNAVQQGLVDVPQLFCRGPPRKHRTPKQPCGIEKSLVQERHWVGEAEGSKWEGESEEHHT